MWTGKFIVFEGIDGSGTSTQARLLHERLVASGIPANKTSEPSMGPAGLVVRQALSHRITLDHRVLALLFAADRLDHLYNRENGIISGLTNGVVEISERYIHSSLAYQAIECDQKWIEDINRFAPWPDVVVYLEVHPGISAQRIAQRQTTTQLFEALPYLERVAVNYYLALRTAPSTTQIIMLDGARSSEIIHNEIWDKVCSIVGAQTRAQQQPIEPGSAREATPPRYLPEAKA